MYVLFYKGGMDIDRGSEVNAYHKVTPSRYLYLSSSGLHCIEASQKVLCNPWIGR